MCGLVGAAGSIYEPQKNTLKLLMYMNYLRGVHSIGINMVIDPPYALQDKETPELVVIKSLGHTENIYDEHPNYFDMQDNIKGNVRYAMVHNRHATIGNVNIKNAHPFEFEDITGMHNGTITKQGLEMIPDHQFFDTDSEAIFHNIQQDGPDAIIPKLWGAYALIWYDNRDQSIYFIRNSQRPLNYQMTPSGIFWSSDPDFLDLAFKKTKTTAVGGIESFEENWLYRWDTKAEFNERKLEKLRKIKGYTPKTYVTTTKTFKPVSNIVQGNFGKSASRGWVDEKKLAKTTKGQYLDFKVGLVTSLRNGQRYLSLTTEVCGTQLEARVFEPEKNLKGALHGDKYNGLVKKIKTCGVFGSPYMLLDTDTLVPYEELPFGDTEDVILYQGFGNELLDKKQYEQKLETKCAHCQSDEEVGKATFFQRDQWLCDNCVVDGMLMAF